MWDIVITVRRRCSLYQLEPSLVEMFIGMFLYKKFFSFPRYILISNKNLYVAMPKTSTPVSGTTCALYNFFSTNKNRKHPFWHLSHSCPFCGFLIKKFFIKEHPYEHFYQAWFQLVQRTRASILINAAGTSFLEIFNLVYNIKNRI
jgi:hypothetical protein